MILVFFLISFLHIAKYSALNIRFKLQPAAMETSGVFGPSPLMFLEYVGSKITKKPSDKQEMEYLIQCILLAVMLANAYSVMGASRWWM